MDKEFVVHKAGDWQVIIPQVGWRLVETIEIGNLYRMARKP